MISFWRKLIIGNLVCIKTCYSFKPTKPFQWPKVQVPKSWYSEITLIDASRHIDQKLPIFREYFWTIFFPWTKMIRATSNQKPTLSKQSSYEKRCFKLEGHPRHVTLPRVDHSKKEKKWMNKKKNWLSCHALENFDWVQTKIKKVKFKKMCWKKTP